MPGKPFSGVGVGVGVANAGADGVAGAAGSAVGAGAEQPAITIRVASPAAVAMPPRDRADNSRRLLTRTSPRRSPAAGRGLVDRREPPEGRRVSRRVPDGGLPLR